MIISASYKTDIPAFYGQWFINRLRAGFCKMVNPYNEQVYHVPLTPDEVDGIVFWTKNIGPFLKHLPEVHRRGYPFIVQYAINGYPRALEHSVVDAERSCDHMRAISQEHGPKVCVWRYDTIVTSSLTPADLHLSNFERLAAALAGTTDEVVISFAQIYRKTLRNMDRAAGEHGFTWSDPPLEEKRALATRLAEIAAGHGMRLTLCSQPTFLVPGAGEARCVDAERLSVVAGRPIAAKLQGNRKECGCYHSRDIGHYDTCPHGCIYCYAVQSRGLAQRRFKQHDPEGEFLFAPASM